MNKTRQKIAEERRRLQENSDDLAMMKRPKLWPNFGVLAMKRTKGHGFDGLETGTLHLGIEIVNGTQRLRYVWIPHSTIFEEIAMDDPRAIIDPDLQSILDDGWMVD